MEANAADTGAHLDRTTVHEDARCRRSAAFRLQKHTKIQ
jgi:hypothetical protein